MKIKLCKICGKPANPFLGKYCSKGCKKEDEKLKREKLKEKKKVSISFLSKKCDLLWSEVIRNIGKCEYCGKKEFLNAHHIFSRNNKSVRWELANGICLCSGHHTFSSTFSPHQTPIEFTRWIENKRGKDYLDNLEKLAHIPLKVTKEYLEEKIAYFNRYLEED